MRTFVVFIPATLWLCSILPNQAHAAEESILDKFSYRGDVVFQGFFLQRDLPLIREGVPRCENFYFQEYTGLKTPCREEEDYYRIRLRTDLLFRPSSYAEILYGMEVGFLTFGRDDPNRTGPGSGGGGSGRVNLETRELLLRLKSKGNNHRVDLGIFSIGTPDGIVLASSGAGLRYQGRLPNINSDLELTFIKAEDNSRVDNDSNGFSDSNFSDIDMATFRWRYSGVKQVKSIIYGVFRRDGDNTAGDSGEEVREISTLYWGGILLQFSYGRWLLNINLIGNGGDFHRPHELTVREQHLLDHNLQLATTYADYKNNVANFVTPEIWRRYRVAAAAGYLELGLNITDNLSAVIQGAAGSGRPGVEPDGSSVEYRRDQFRTAGSGFQLSDIAVDTSGGYSLFVNGQLTGLAIGGGGLKYNIHGGLQLSLRYFHIEYYRTPVADFNENYRLHHQVRQNSNYVGAEWNLWLKWMVFSDLSLDLRLGWFDAGAGYKIVHDVVGGDRIFESSLAIKQKF